MNITFLIGNGFDMGLGLKTGYRDFYPYFLDEANPFNMIRKQIEEDEEVGKIYDKWSDLEYALGTYTEKISGNTYNQFRYDKMEMDELLIEYLKKERTKIKFDDEKLRSVVINALYSIRDWKTEKDRMLVERILKFYITESYNYYAISFNYTDCIDYMFDAIKNKNELIKTHNVGNTVYGESVKEVLHIHGTLDDEEMILGVNDSTQIKNIGLVNSTDIEKFLIKSQLNLEIGQNKINKARNIIDKSGIVCVYGMSLGETDKMWWEYIGRWLTESASRILIIFNYNLDYRGVIPYRVLDYKDSRKEEFLLRAGIENLDEEVKKDIKERILIRINDNIFAFKE